MSTTAVDGCTAGAIVGVTIPSEPYDIDLHRSEADRWSDVVAKEAPTARALADKATDELPWLARWLATPLGTMFGIAYSLSGGLYGDEIKCWARGMGVSSGLSTILNCGYELSYLDPSYKFGCTAGAVRLRDYGIVHLRNLDWSVPGLGAGTRLFRFHGPRHCFIAVGTVGFVGVLSGMVPGQYSVTINWAPPDRWLWPTAFGRFGAAFWLRRTLETCATADDAISALARESLATGVFYTVCDAVRAEAVVIERVADDSNVRRGPLPLVQTNHFGPGNLERGNRSVERPETPGKQTERACSEERMRALTSALGRLASDASLEDAAALLEEPPVLNLETAQQMAFAPLRGEVLARGVEVARAARTVPCGKSWARVTMRNDGGQCERCRP